MIKKLGILWLLLSLGGLGYAQDSPSHIPIRWKGKWNPEIQDLLSKRSQVARDTGRISQYISALSSSMRTLGYPELRIRVDSARSDTLLITLYSGPKYVVKKLELKDLPEKVGTRALQKWIKSRPPVDWEVLDEKLKRLLAPFPDWGYPFARLDQQELRYNSLDSSLMEVELMYQFHTGPLVRIQSLNFEGDFQEKNQFVQAIGRIFPGDIYHQTHISQLARLLRNSRYFDEAAAPQISFPEPDQAAISLALKPSKRGRFDAVLGVLPPSEANQNLQFTGLVQLALTSSLGLGEYLFLDYKSLRAGSQQLDVAVEFPYLLRLPFGIKGNLEMLKQESAFLNVRGGGSLVYYVKPNLEIGLNIIQQNSRLLEIGEGLVDTTNALLQADGNRSMVGLGIQFENLDYPINTTQGVFLSVSANTGTREIRQNRLIPEEKYQDIPESQATREIRWELRTYFPIGRRQVIHAAFRGFHLDQAHYFQNDQLLIGGSQNLRGFNENEFFTDSYQQFTVEYRFLLERESNLFIFGDYASLRNQVQRNGEGRIHPLGVGIGMSYGTRAGILSISYGIGQASAVNIPFEPSRGKIHIGLINRF
ncbi:MAG: BamA/TamA family outer membrane protein [Bacteroidota bacterium]